MVTLRWLSYHHGRMSCAAVGGMACTSWLLPEFGRMSAQDIMARDVPSPRALLDIVGSVSYT